MKISKRLAVYVAILSIIMLAIPSQVFCQTEVGGTPGAGTPGPAAPGAGAAGAGAAGGEAALAGVGWGTIALSAGLVAAVAAIGIAASGGGSTATTAHH